MKFLTVSFLAIFGLLYFHFNDSTKFSISIERKLTTDNCITGYLSINNNPICYTMELPYRGNINNISSIPKGKYDAFIRSDKNLGWRIELINVRGRENIQIHVGNYTSDITGCVLVGKSVKINNCSTGQSNNALKEIEKMVRDFKSDLCLKCNSTEEYTIEVEYR